MIWLVAGALLVAGMVVQPVVGRLWPDYEDPARLARLLLVEGVAAFAFAWFAVGLAREGGPLFVGLAVVCTLLAVLAVILGAVFVWAFVHRPSDEHE